MVEGRNHRPQEFVIEWGSTPADADRLAHFFVNGVTDEYISHGELQTGRAVTVNQWSPSLAQHVAAELRDCLSEQDVTDRRSGVVVARNQHDILALAIISFHRGVNQSYCIIEDLLVAPSHRSHGIGQSMLEWIEQEAKERRISCLFLESGIHNVRAHDFFHRYGFRTCSVTMMKSLDPADAVQDRAT